MYLASSDSLFASMVVCCVSLNIVDVSCLNFFYVPRFLDHDVSAEVEILLIRDIIGKDRGHGKECRCSCQRDAGAQRVAWGGMKARGHCEEAVATLMEHLRGECSVILCHPIQIESELERQARHRLEVI